MPQAFIDPIECKKGIECLENFRREYDENMGKFKDNPRHDWAQHGYDGLETLVRGLNAHGVITDVPVYQPVQVELSLPRDPYAGY